MVPSALVTPILVNTYATILRRGLRGANKIRSSWIMDNRLK